MEKIIDAEESESIEGDIQIKSEEHYDNEEFEDGAEEYAYDQNDEDTRETADETEIIYMVSPDEVMTSDLISFTEYTELTGIRAEQIARYNNPFIDIGGMTDPIQMANREFSARKSPLVIRRKLGVRRINGKLCTFYESVYPNTAVHPEKSYNDMK